MNTKVLCGFKPNTRTNTQRNSLVRTLWPAATSQSLHFHCGNWGKRGGDDFFPKIISTIKPWPREISKDNKK